MKEHHKMEPTDNIPEGLEYKTAYWDSALSQIKRKEAQLFWYKLFGLASILLLIAGTAYWQLKQKEIFANSYQLAQSQISKDPSAMKQQFSNNNASLQARLQQNTGSLSDQAQTGTKPLENADTASKTPLAKNQFNSENQATTEAAASPINGSSINSNNKQHRNVPLHKGAEANAKHASSNETEHSSNLAQETRVQLVGKNPELNPSTNELQDENESQRTNREAKVNGEKTAEKIDAIATKGDSMGAAQPEGSMLENEKPSFGNWKLVPTALKSKQVQNIPQSQSRADASLLVGNLKSLSRSFPIPHYSIQLVLGNGFRTQFGSRLNGARFQPIAGLAFDCNLSKKWSFNVQGNYSQVTDVLRSIERTNQQLDYILRSQTTLLSTTKLHFMNLPVRVSRRIGERHQIHTGLGISYLLTTDNLLQVNSQTSFESEQEEAQKTQGYTQGWQPFSTFGLLGYSYYLKPSASISVSYQYGFTDMTDNAEFTSSAFDRNSQLNLTLHFNLIER